ncbi:MAG: undecaprenyldiphospho-muramoylpentapeptide beta-N-acetylglucosaminyltransferase [Sumerlaeia bacterium]
MQEQRRLLFVAGGTGGHITPSLAVANYLRKEYLSGVEIQFVTGNKEIEKTAFHSVGETPFTLSCERPPSLSLVGIARAFRLLASCVEAYKLIGEYKPHALFATGGYVCFPVLTAARLRGIPYYLHESNSVPGKVTRLFSRSAQCVFLGTSITGSQLNGAKTELCGTPIRAELSGITRHAALRHFGFERNATGILILGGSQGAAALNDVLRDLLASPTPIAAGKPLNIIWVAGPLHAASCRALVESQKTPHTIQVVDYISNMGEAYAAVDLVISRAGAGTIAELLALRKPSILIPYPHAADNHQLHNANALSNAGAAVVIEEKDLGFSLLQQKLAELLSSPAKLDQMAEACGHLCPKNVLPRIAERLMAPLPHSPAQQVVAES